MKSRLYKLLRGILSQDWVKYLDLVVKQYNTTPKQKLGGLTPDSIHSEFDSVLVAEARKQKKISVFKQPHYQQQIINQKNYEQNKNLLQVNDYVYLTTNEKLFDKSFDTQVVKKSYLTVFFSQSKKIVTKCFKNYHKTSQFLL